MPQTGKVYPDRNARGEHINKTAREVLKYVKYYPV
jgi:hypothetical protein